MSVWCLFYLFDLYKDLTHYGGTYHIGINEINYCCNCVWYSDIKIYFNDKSFSTYDSVTRKSYYNDRNHFITIENDDPNDYFKYANSDTISMSFEGPFYEIINNFDSSPFLKQFDSLLKEYGLYYELGNAWNLSCYYIKNT